MKRILYITILSFLLPLTISSQNRMEILLEKGWKFYKGDTDGAEKPSFDDVKWEQVTVPHDWAIYGPFDKEIDLQKVAILQNGETVPTEKTGRTGALPYIGVGWYRSSFALPKSAHGKKVTLLFDGAMSEARVYLNGREVGFWPNGYNSFYFDISSYIKNGKENILAVRLENRPESSRWYPGAGLYRPVKVLVTNDVAVQTWGTSITTPVVSEQFAKIKIKTEIDNAAGKSLRIHTIIKDKKGAKVAESNKNVDFIDNFTEDLIVLNNPELWSPETPSLYYAEQNIYEDDQLKDEYTTRFGIRDVRVSPEGGFMLNGKSLKLKGACLHHDLGPIGAALNKAALRRQLQIMKDMGANAIRTSHNMPSPWQMDLCDEMGLMVMAESFDEWQSPKCKNGYNRFFKEWAEKDLVNLIRCHRNHPSIVMWCVGNEVPEQSIRHGNKIAKRLQDICHREDPSRLVTCGIDQVDNAIKSHFAAVFDIPGLNYRTHKYEEAYDKLPQGFILGSETASTVSSRGVYKYPVKEEKQKMYADAQCSSYDLEACGWSNIPEDDWMLQDDKSWTIGEFVWTGFDYLGEPTPYDNVWPSRSSYFGICDLAGLPKDRYYLYRSHWNTKEHTLHLLPHWNWEGREGQVTPVYCYTDYPSAELFVNGKSQGRRTKEASVREDRYRLRWNDVKYEPGSIKVIAYDEAGNAVGEKEIRTAGKPHHLELSVDRNQLTADGNDMAFVTAKVVDKDGNLCPNADNLLNFKVTGSGIYRAACSGDATSVEQFHLPKMKVFKGMLVILVQTKEEEGTIRLDVSGKGLKPMTLKLNAHLPL